MGDEVYSGATDIPDDRDYIASHVLGIEEGFLPDKVKLMTKADDQGNSVMCTCFGVYHVGRILNEIEKKMELDGLPDKGWELQKQFGTYSSKGDSMQTALKSLIRNGLHCSEKVFKIDGYALTKDEELKYWLAKGFPIYTGASVTKTNFKKAKYEGTWSGIDGAITGGHAIALIGYEDGFYWALNSYGEDWGYFDDGTFKIKESDVKSMFSKYIVYDHKDVFPIFRDVSTDSPFADEIRLCLEKGLMTGYNTDLPPEDRFFKPDQPITRAELAAVMSRLYKLFYRE